MTKGHIFASPKNGLLSVLDHIFSEQQARGFTIKSHNVLSRDDVCKLYGSPELSKNTPAAYKCRMIFNIAPITKIRPRELFKSPVSQLYLVGQGEDKVWRIQGRISTIDRTQSVKGGFKAVKIKLK